jgi:mRNA interferase RelE/StbE
MAYQVNFTSSADKEFVSLPRHVQARLKRRIDLLATDPRGSGSKKLSGYPNLWRVHASKDYVVVYSIWDEEIVVLVVRVAHRREVYRGL